MKSRKSWCTEDMRLTLQREVHMRQISINVTPAHSNVQQLRFTKFHCLFKRGYVKLQGYYNRYSSPYPCENWFPYQGRCLGIL